MMYSVLEIFIMTIQCGLIYLHQTVAQVQLIDEITSTMNFLNAFINFFHNTSAKSLSLEFSSFERNIIEVQVPSSIFSS